MKTNSTALHNSDANETQKVYDFASLSSSSNTLRAYSTDWKCFLTWATTKNKQTLPANPDDVATYLRYCSEKLKLKISSILRRLSAISEMHKRNRLHSPADEWVVRHTAKRLKQELSKEQISKKPLLVNDIKKMLNLCPETLSGKRDKAVLLLGFVSALKRNELARLELINISKCPQGLVISISDRKIGIPYGKNKDTCPVTALLDWIEAAKIKEGPVFRAILKNDRARYTKMSDKTVADIVKKYTSLIGKSEENFAAHSLRSGLATSAAIAGATEASIQKQTGHKSLALLRRYLPEEALFTENVVGKLGL